MIGHGIFVDRGIDVFHSQSLEYSRIDLRGTGAMRRTYAATRKREQQMVSSASTKNVP